MENYRVLGALTSVQLLYQHCATPFHRNDGRHHHLLHSTMLTATITAFNSITQCAGALDLQY
jgi:hypothetical protein